MSRPRFRKIIAAQSALAFLVLVYVIAEWRKPTGTATPNGSPPIAQVLLGHTGYVYSVDFSPDGRYLASGSRDGTVRLWSVASGQTVRVLRVNAGCPSSVRFSPDGRLLAAGVAFTARKTIWLWATDTGKLRHVLQGRPGVVHSIVFSADGQMLAAGESGNEITLWEASSWKPIRELTGGIGAWGLLQDIAQGGVRLTSDGLLIAGGGDGITRMWEVKTGRAPQLLEGRSPVEAIAVSSDGRLLATANLRGVVSIWDCRKHQVIKTISLPSGLVRALDFRPRTHRLAVGIPDGAIRLYDAFSGQIVESFPWHKGTVFVRPVRPKS
jgi:WD40 repeat protein